MSFVKTVRGWGNYAALRWFHGVCRMKGGIRWGKEGHGLVKDSKTGLEK